MANPPSFPNTPLEPAKVIRVVDGDTIIVRLINNNPECNKARVRLIGIDAPESVAPQKWRNTPEGIHASHITAQLVPQDSTIWLQRDYSDTDEYGRLLRYAWLERPNTPDSTKEICSKMLNAILIKNNAANARSYPPDTSLDILFSAIGG